MRPETTPDVLDQIVAWGEDGRGVALATVIHTWGSSPRPAGSLLGIDEEGRMVGSVSGGCVEGAVVDAARAAIESGQHQSLDFGVTDEMAWEVGLACGGEMRVFVDRVVSRDAKIKSQEHWLGRLQTERAGRRAAAMTIDLATGRRQVICPGSAQPGAASDSPELDAAVQDALRSDSPQIVERGPKGMFVQPFNPPLRLIVVGAVHIAQALCRMAAETGYAVTVVDPRGAFASEERFPDVARVSDWPDDALAALNIDRRTAVVTLTHDPKLDDPALAVALRSDAFYVGSLGSRRTQARRLERLAALGLDAAATARIHGPVGLDIGARSPAEIAVSILAEITACLRERDD